MYWSYPYHCRGGLTEAVPDQTSISRVLSVPLLCALSTLYTYLHCQKMYSGKSKNRRRDSPAMFSLWCVLECLFSLHSHCSHRYVSLLHGWSGSSPWIFYASSGRHIDDWRIWPVLTQVNHFAWTCCRTVYCNLTAGYSGSKAGLGIRSFQKNVPFFPIFSVLL